MKTRLLKGLSKERKDEMKAVFSGCRPFLERLEQVLQEDLDASLNEMSKKQNYSDPAWSESMADRLGEQRTLRMVLDLIKED